MPLEPRRGPGPARRAAPAGTRGPARGDARGARRTSPPRRAGCWCATAARAAPPAAHGSVPPSPQPTSATRVWSPPAASPSHRPPLGAVLLHQSWLPLETPAQPAGPGLARGESPRCGGCGELRPWPSSGRGRPPASLPLSWGAAPGSPGPLCRAAPAGRRGEMRGTPRGDGAAAAGGTAHLPAVPVVDAAAVLHAVQHQVPPQGLHGVVIPLAGVGEGGRRVNQVGQREVADAWGQERWQRLRAGSGHGRGPRTSPEAGQDADHRPSSLHLLCSGSFPSPPTKAESVLKNVYRGAYFIFRLWPLARDLPRSASPPCRSAQTSIHFN